MYLTPIDTKTGLIKLSEEDDGVLSIKEFREVIYDEELGLKCFTAIALTADYKSPLRFYSDADRPKKAMEEVIGDRSAFNWNLEKIQAALIKYDELQFDLTVEEGKIHFQRKLTALEDLKESERYFGKPHNRQNSDGEKMIFENPEKISIRLRKINEDLKKYNEYIQGNDVYENSPSRGGYKLSRLEQKAEKKKNTFYQDKR